MQDFNKFSAIRAKIQHKTTTKIIRKNIQNHEKKANAKKMKSHARSNAFVYTHKFARRHVNTTRSHGHNQHMYRREEREERKGREEREEREKRERREREKREKREALSRINGPQTTQLAEHRAQSTEHRAQSTQHRAQSTEHKAQNTKHRAQSTDLSQPSTC